MGVGHGSVHSTEMPLMPALLLGISFPGYSTSVAAAIDGHYPPWLDQGNP